MSVPYLYQRYEDYVELVFIDRPGVAAWDVSADFPADTAFTSPTQVFTVRKTAGYRSASLRRRRGIAAHRDAGRTRALVNWDDLWTGGSTVPHNFEPAYVRVREVFEDGVVGAWGPLFYTPPPHTFTTPRAMISMKGTAPQLFLPANGLAPTGAFHVVLPRFADWVSVTATTSTPLQVAPGISMEMQEVRANTEIHFSDGAVKELVLIGVGGTAPFDIRAAIVNGEMA